MAPEACPGGIATSKPGRERWAEEELWDLVVKAQPDGRVEKTAYRGVFFLYADPDRLARVVGSEEFAFVKRITITRKCYKIDNIVNDLDGSVYSGECIEIRLRGACKRIAEKLIKDKCKINKRKKLDECAIIHVVEGIDKLIMLATGRPRSCGVDCIAVIDVQATI